MRRNRLLEALFPPMRRRSKEELLQQLEDDTASLHEQVKRSVATLAEKERRVLALRFAGDSPEDERGRALLREVEQDQKGDTSNDHQ